MSQALSSQRSWIARIAVLALLASLMAFGAAPASAAIDTSDSCPTSIPDAGFTDLAGVPAAAVGAINCIADYGISTGTTATTFDPFGTVERWQMALFITRQVEAHGLAAALPANPAEPFTDLAGVPAAAVLSINQIAALSISLGVGPDTFEPFENVERWQMALFLARLIDIAIDDNSSSDDNANNMPDGSDQGFTDLAGVPASAVTAINQLVQLGVADGTTATTFDPFADVERWQMALFLARTLAADGIAPVGVGFIVTETPGSPDFKYADTNQGKEITAKTKSTDNFSVDGTSATQGAFFASLTVGDLVSVSNLGTYMLTNVKLTSYTSGVIDVFNSGANTYAIVEPITGTVLNTVSYDGVHTLYTTDGSGTGIAGFEADVQAGDLVVSTGTGADAANIRTLALTNQIVAGAAASVASPAFKVSPFGDTFTPVATDSITIDGATDTLANWTTELSNGDDVTVARNDGKLTVTLVNKASSAISGKVLNNNDTAGNTVDVDGYPNEPYAVGATFIVNGVIDDIVGFETAHTAGDDISIVRADGQINTVDRITLTDASFSGTPKTVTASTVTVLFKTGGDESEAIDYTTLTPDVGLTGTGSVKYSIPGNTAATVAQFTAALNNAAVNGGTVSVAKVGTDIVWTLAS